MPTRVEKRGSQYCVVSTETGDIEKCYDNEPKAKAYSAALNIAHAKKKGYIHSELPLGDDIKTELHEWSDIE